MGEMGKSKLNRDKVRKILIGICCVAIAVCVAFVMFRVYNPSQNALKALSSVCMDVICLIILFILISSFAFNNYGVNRTTRLFSGLILATIWALFLDFLNWAFDGLLQFGNMTFWFTTGSLCMGAVLACVFSVYLYRYMAETHNIEQMRKSSIVCAILNVCSFFVTFILAITGVAFEFVDGHYELGALYDVVTIIPVLTLLYLTGFIIRHVKKIGWHDVIAVCGYIIFMIAGALIEAEYGIGTTYVAVAIADIFIFVMLQNEIITLEKRNALEWMKKSNTDNLTGFGNRNAYVTDLDAIDSSPIDDDFVYISVDVNSLKNINDTHGHSAGDELIGGAAECLKKCFGEYGMLYRTGGDEFIGLLKMTEEELKKAQKDIENLTKNWKGSFPEKLTISCGYVTGSEAKKMNVSQIAILADERMYAAKAEYYKATGIERRKK